MLFRVTGFKQDQQNKINLDFLIDAISQLQIRKFLEEKGFLILSVKEYQKSKEEFGNMRFKVANRISDFQIILNTDDMYKSCSELLIIGFDVVDGNRFQNQLSAEDAKKIIENAAVDVNAKKLVEKKDFEEKQDAEKKMYQDKKVKEMQQKIQMALDQISEITNRVQGNASGTNLKKLKEREDELKKIRLGTNEAKMVDILDKIYNLMEIIYTDYADFVKNQEGPVLRDSVVSNLDIVAETNKFEKSKMVKLFGLTPNANDNYYIFMGKVGMFAKFLQADIWNWAGNYTNIFYKFFDIAEFVILIILSEFGVYFWVNHVLDIGLDVNKKFLVMISIGVIGLILFLFKLIRKKNAILLLIYVPLIIGISYVVINLVFNTFAL